MKQTIWNEVIKMTGIICALKIEVDGLKSAMDSSEEKTISIDFIVVKSTVRMLYFLNVVSVK